MKKLACLVLFLVLCSSCHKNNDLAPDAGTAETTGIGGLSGTISPIGVINVITASMTVSGQASVHSAFPDQNGKFTFNDLPSGTYTVSLNVSDVRYSKPADIKATVKRAQTTDIGTVPVSFDPDNGSMSGIVSPAGAAVSISSFCYNPIVNGSTYQDPVSGVFKISNLPAGSYTLSFIAASGFYSPSTRTVTVSARQNTDAGTFSFDQYGKIKNLSFQVNGTALSMTGTGSYLSNNFVMQGAYADGPGQQSGTKIYHLNIALDKVTAPGTYICNSGTVSNVTYSWSIYNYIGTGGSWTSHATGGSATVVVTAIDPAANTISGTFTATLVAAAGPNAGTNQVITAGTFVTNYK